MSRKPASIRCPEIVLDWIAWYSEGDLPEEVRSTIEVHAAECSACRQEIASLTGDPRGETAADARAERVFARTQHKIETGPRRAATPARRRHWVVRPRVAVAVGLAVAILSGTAGVIATHAGVVYETATASWDDRVASGPHLDVVFRDDASFAQIARAIQALGASVESGPTPNGVVHLHLRAGADPIEAARRLESGDLAVADFAQPAP